MIKAKKTNSERIRRLINEVSQKRKPKETFLSLDNTSHNTRDQTTLILSGVQLAEAILDKISCISEAGVIIAASKLKATARSFRCSYSELCQEPTFCKHQSLQIHSP